MKLKVVDDIGKFLQFWGANFIYFLGFWRFIEQISQNHVFGRFYGQKRGVNGTIVTCFQTLKYAFNVPNITWSYSESGAPELKR